MHLADLSKTENFSDSELPVSILYRLVPNRNDENDITVLRRRRPAEPHAHLGVMLGVRFFR